MNEYIYLEEAHPTCEKMVKENEIATYTQSKI